jgi:hypothetical protein
MRNEIQKTLEKIHNEITKTGGQLSILGGIYGHALFDFYFRKEFKLNFEYSPKLTLQSLAEESFKNTNPTFCNGISGLRWYFSFLYYNNIIDVEDLQILTPRDTKIENTSLDMLSIGNYDFLHGAIGIAYNILYSETWSSPTYLYSVIHKLSQLIDISKHKKMIPAFDSNLNKSVPNIINLGFAHGITSILKFCMECYKKNLFKNKSKELADLIINFLLNNSNQNKSESYYPYSIDLDTSKNISSRLAWCYGDLTIGYILYHAGQIFANPKSQLFGKDILINCTTRKTYKETMIMDGGVCHGSAGIAYIFNKFWRETGDPIFKNATEYWIERTLNYFNRSLNANGYKKYISSSNQFELDSSLLEGSAGIGLVLLSYLSNDFEWDHCLMLNN